MGKAILNLAGGGVRSPQSAVRGFLFVVCCFLLAVWDLTLVYIPMVSFDNYRTAQPVEGKLKFWFVCNLTISGCLSGVEDNRLKA